MTLKKFKCLENTMKMIMDSNSETQKISKRARPHFMRFLSQDNLPKGYFPPQPSNIPLTSLALLHYSSF